MEKVKESKEKYHIEILVVLKEVQQQHGLRHKDYHSYHQYISRKLHRMRKSLNFPQGKGNRVIPKKLTRNVVTESRFILLKLFEAERAWACAMQLKDESNTEPRKVYHMRLRLSRAVQRSRELWEMCKWDKCSEHPDVEKCEQCAICDAHTYVETQAYYYSMEATRFLELAEWGNAKAMYERAFREYSGLAKAVEKDHEQIYLNKAEEMRPLIRYCANNEGDLQSPADLAAIHAAGGDLEHFDDLLKQIYKNQVAVMTEVNWLGIIIPVKSENVRMSILALMDANKELMTAKNLENAAKIAIYDSMLKTCTDALNYVREDLKIGGVLNAVQVNNQPLANMSRLQILFVYLQYVKLTKTVERNLLLIDANIDSCSNKPQNIARLYDTVIQNLQEMSSLPGLNSESEETNGQHEIQAKISMYKAHRCYYLSQAHLLMKMFSECAALLSRSLKHCEAVLTNLQIITGNDSVQTGVAVNGRLIAGPLPTELESQVKEFLDMVEADQLICRANRCLSLIDDATADVSIVSKNIEKPLLERLDEYMEDPSLSKKNSSTGKLIRNPPEFEPIPVKPIFFDLAFYHVKFPNLDDKIRDKKSKDAENKGITGMVKGWIWGSGK